PRFAIGRMPDAALDAQRRKCRHLGSIGICVGPDVETQVVSARRTHGGAFEDRLPAMGTSTGGPGAARAQAVHELLALSALYPLPCLPCFGALSSSQPNWA